MFSFRSKKQTSKNVADTAFKNNTHTSRDIKYVAGDRVFFKNIKERCWRGPGRLLGQHGQKVMVVIMLENIQVDCN